MAATNRGGKPQRLGLVLLVAAFVLSTLGCFKSPSYVLEKTIALPDSLSGLSLDAIAYSRRDNRVFVGLQDRRVLVVDAVTGRKLAIVPSSGPGSPVYDPATDDVYLSDAESSLPASAQYDTIPYALGEMKMWNPQEMDVDRASSRVTYRSDGGDLVLLDSRTLGAVWTTPSEVRRPWEARSVCCNTRMHLFYATMGENDPLTVFDSRTGRIVGAVSIGGNPSPLCYNSRDNKLYVVSYLIDCPDGSISVLDCSSNHVDASIPVKLLDLRLVYCPLEDKVYVGARDSDVVVLDGKSNRVSARVRMPGQTEDVVYDSASNRLYCSGKDWVAAIDCRSDTVVGLVRTNTSGGQTRVVSSGSVSKLYYLQWDPCVLYGIGCSKFAVASKTTIGYYLGVLSYNAGRDKVYCAAYCGVVAVIDAAAEKVLTIMQVGRDPWALCGNKSGSRVYCANMGSGSVSVIDALADTVVTSIEVRGAPVALCYCTHHEKVYCAGTEPDEPAPDTSTKHALSVIDCRTNRVVQELNVPMDFRSRIMYDDFRDRVYVTIGSGIDERVSVIDARGDTVVAVPAAGPGPDRRLETAAKLGKWATGVVAYDPRHRRLFAASEQSSVVVLREERAAEDFGEALRHFGTSVSKVWERLVRPAERTRSGIAR